MYMKELKASDRLKTSAFFRVTQVQSYNTGGNYK